MTLIVPSEQINGVLKLFLLYMPVLRLQKEHLARMYRLFNRIKNGLDPVALIFRKHVESEGMKIVTQASEDATAKKEKDAGAIAPG